MQITNLSAQIKNPDRVNVFIDGKFRFGLDVSQIVDLDLKVGLEIDNQRLAELELESQFGKLYTQALNYCLMRPRSVREVRDYLWRKSQPKLLKSGRKTEALPADLSERVIERLLSKGYLDDVKFTTWWVENRFLKKGVSQRRLRQDLFKKGVTKEVIDQILATTDRQDETELLKVIAKKSPRYSDVQKLKAYLVRQGFNYDDINQALTQKTD